MAIPTVLIARIDGTPHDLGAFGDSLTARRAVRAYFMARRRRGLASPRLQIVDPSGVILSIEIPAENWYPPKRWWISGA
jgi:hypothetical protein